MSIDKKVYVRSIKGSERRTRMDSVMKKMGWDFSYWDNVHYEDKEFSDFVKAGKVKISENYMKKYYDAKNQRTPTHTKHILYPGQVANHLSMINLFKHISSQKIDNEYIFIMEDDVVIKDYANDVFERLLPQIKNDLYICGVGWGWLKKRRMEHLDNKVEDYNLRFSAFRYCNPFFVTNQKTIKYIVNNLCEDTIDMPCDVWLHNYTTVIDKKINRCLIYPALCKELSYSGHIDSDITPKSSRINVLSSKKNLSKEEEQKLSNLRVQYQNKEINCKKFWRDNYGL